MTPDPRHFLGLAAACSFAGFAFAAQTVSVPLPVPRPQAQIRPIAPLPQPRPVAPRSTAPLGSTAAIPMVPPLVPPAPSGTEGGACLATLEQSGVAFTIERVEAIRPECRPIDPVRVRAIAAEGWVTLSSPALLNCPMSRVLAQWVRGSVVPASAEILGEVPSRILVGAGHDCRSRNRVAGAMLSEHATANAIDVVGFELGDGRRVQVDEDWGDGTPAGAFLARVHGEACEYFHTVLGPEADAAHADHFHLDLRRRGRAGDARFCQ